MYEVYNNVSVVTKEQEQIAPTGRSVFLEIYIKLYILGPITK